MRPESAFGTLARPLAMLEWVLACSPIQWGAAGPCAGLCLHVGFVSVHVLEEDAQLMGYHCASCFSKRWDGLAMWPS